MGDPLLTAAQSRPWLEAIAQVSRAVNSPEPLDNVLDAVARTTCQLLSYDFGAALLVDAEHQRLLIRGSHGLTPAYVASVNNEKPIRLGHGQFGEGPSSRAFRTREPVIVRDYRTDPAVGPWSGVASEQGFRSLAVVPLIVSGDAIGTLNCYTRGVHDFSEDEILLIATMANNAASAIEAARLRMQEQATIARLEDTRRSLVAQTRILERSEEVHSELTGAVLADAGIDAIAATLSAILGSPIIIDDVAGYVVAEAGKDAAAASALTAVHASRATRIAEQLAMQRPMPIGVDPQDGASRASVTPVMIGSQMVARLWMALEPKEMGGLERRALEHGATVVALELLKQRIATEVESRLSGELLDDLLEGRTSDQPGVEARAKHLGFSLLGQYSALVVQLVDAHPPDEGAGDDGRRRQLYPLVSSTVRRLRANALVGERDGSVVVLVGEAAGRSIADRVSVADRIRADVRRVLGGSSALVAIGPRVDHVADASRSYAIARGALVIAYKSGAHDRTVTLDDLGVCGLLLTVDGLDNLVEYARATLQPLRDHDGRRGGALLPTLRSYLSNGCRTAETARELVVHPNTVAYRIRRIERLLDVDVSQPESLLRVQLALVVDQIVDARPDPRRLAGTGRALGNSDRGASRP